MYVAVPIPPLRLFRLGGESRYDALGLFLHLLLHFGLSRKAFLSETLAGKAVMARTLPLRIIHATDNKRPPFVRPTERYRSSLSIGSKLRSTGSLFSNLLELRGRYLVGVQVLLVLVIPIEFDWDDENKKHLDAHKVSPAEFEQIAEQRSCRPEFRTDR